MRLSPSMLGEYLRVPDTRLMSLRTRKRRRVRPILMACSRAGADGGSSCALLGFGIPRADRLHRFALLHSMHWRESDHSVVSGNGEYATQHLQRLAVSRRTGIAGQESTGLGGFDLADEPAHPARPFLFKAPLLFLLAAYFYETVVCPARRVPIKALADF